MDHLAGARSADDYGADHARRYQPERLDGGQPGDCHQWSQCWRSANGIDLEAGSAGTIVEGLNLENFGQYGVLVASANNTIEADWIGLNAGGTAAAGNGYGVYIDNVAGNTIGGLVSAASNVISGNTNDGVYITGASATGNVVEGNDIGTNPSGNAPLGNGGNGVSTNSVATGNTIGGSVSGAGNVISNNTNYGVGLFTSGNLVDGNTIGLNALGTGKLANLYGVGNTAGGNTIRGTAPGARNIISGNTDDGIASIGSMPETIEGNYIGTNSSGGSSVDWGMGPAESSLVRVPRTVQSAER